MYSLPIRVTFAALTMASAASIEPMRPRVSMSPSASRDITLQARNSSRLREMRQLRYHVHSTDLHRRFDLISRDLLPMIVFDPRRAVALGIAVIAISTIILSACRRKEVPAPPVA